MLALGLFRDGSRMEDVWCIVGVLLSTAVGTFSAIDASVAGGDDGGKGIRRTSLDRRSPIDGPPSTRMISLDEPAERKKIDCISKGDSHYTVL